MSLTKSVVLVATILAMAGSVEPSSSPIVTPENVATFLPKRDPGYEFSVDEVESVESVENRARKVLGDRFVELWFADDQSSYMIGVHDLDSDEVPRLRKAIRRHAAVQFVKKSVSREELDAVAESVEEVLDLNDPNFSSYWVDYKEGVVVVGVEAGSRDQLATAIESEVDIVTRDDDDPRVIRNGVTQSQFSTPQVIVRDDELEEAENANANPYRAGKLVSIGGTAANCTAGFTVWKGLKLYGLTAGHCGKNGRAVYFAKIRRGNIQNNTLWARNPARTDAALFHLQRNTSATLFRSTTFNRKVTGSYSASSLKYGKRVCARGAFTANQRCGTVVEVNVHTVSNTANRVVQNGYGWKWDSLGLRAGDSGSPVYVIRANGSVWAMGIHRASNASRKMSYFTPIATVMSDTGTRLYTTK